MTMKPKMRVCVERQNIVSVCYMVFTHLEVHVPICADKESLVL